MWGVGMNCAPLHAFCGCNVPEVLGFVLFSALSLSLTLSGTVKAGYHWGWGSKQNFVEGAMLQQCRAPLGMPFVAAVSLEQCTAFIVASIPVYVI